MALAGAWVAGDRDGRVADTRLPARADLYAQTTNVASVRAACAAACAIADIDRGNRIRSDRLHASQAGKQELGCGSIRGVACVYGYAATALSAGAHLLNARRSDFGRRDIALGLGRVQTDHPVTGRVIKRAGRPQIACHRKKYALIALQGDIARRREPADQTFGTYPDLGPDDPVLI